MKPIAKILVLSTTLMAISAVAHAGTITLPVGAQLRVVLETTLTTKTTKVGDPFRARLVLPVWANEREILPIGTAVKGTVVSLKGPGRVKGRAEMQLRPEMLILPDARDISLGASLESARTGEDDVKIDPKEGTVKGGGKDGMNGRQVATGATLGAAIGLGTAGGKGAAVGAGAVGAIAVLHQVFKRGKHAGLPAGSELVLEVTRAVSFSDMQEVPPSPAQKTGTSEPAAPYVVPIPLNE